MEPQLTSVKAEMKNENQYLRPKYEPLNVFQRQYLKKGTQQLMKMALVPARIWAHETLGFCPTRRLKIRRHVAEMLGVKKDSASLDIF